MTPILPMPLRVVIVSQEDAFTIPSNVARVLAVPGIEVRALFVLDVKGSLVNRKRTFAAGFGFWQSARMAAVLLWARGLDALDRLSGYRLLARKRSLKAIARHAGVPYEVTGSAADLASHDRLRTLAPDVVLSFSAPCVFPSALLRLPPRGCINLHCSLLPRYAGLLPSFWVLFHGEKATGSTVHLMDDRIDNGGILAQAEVPIDSGVSMFHLIERTKAVGGELVCDVLARMRDGREVAVHPNRAENGSYFTWPTVAQMREFRRRGGRLI